MIWTNYNHSLRPRIWFKLVMCPFSTSIAFSLESNYSCVSNTNDRSYSHCGNFAPFRKSSNRKWLRCIILLSHNSTLSFIQKMNCRRYTFRIDTLVWRKKWQLFSQDFAQHFNYVIFNEVVFEAISANNSVTSIQIEQIELWICFSNFSTDYSLINRIFVCRVFVFDANIYRSCFTKFPSSSLLILILLLI